MRAAAGVQVVDQGDGRYAEADGRVVERAEHRYVLSVKLADHTGSVNVQLFNKEVCVGVCAVGRAEGTVRGGRQRDRRGCWWRRQTAANVVSATCTQQ